MTDVLADLREKMEACTTCDLHRCRNKLVFGEGNQHSPKIMFVGEAPGQNEDEQGVPFVGACGDKLDEMISFLGLTRNEVYIANAVLCRPPNNRDPHMSEVEACRWRLLLQIETVQPELLVLLGRGATKAILGYEFKGPLSQFMDEFIQFDLNGTPYNAAVVWHPSAHIRGAARARKATGPQWKRIKQFTTASDADGNSQSSGTATSSPTEVSTG